MAVEESTRKKQKLQEDASGAGLHVFQAAQTLDESHPVAKLWQTLLKGNVQRMRRKRNNAPEALVDTEPTESTSDTGAIVLPPGTAWLHKSTAGRASRQLFVRECSYQICDLIEERHRKDLGGAVVLGTPGIGKRWLSNLLLLRAAKEKRNVIFESVPEDVAYFFNGMTGKVQRVRAPRNIDWPSADDRNTLYIMDAGGKGVYREPARVSAFTVVLASPNEKHYGQFAKELQLAPLFLPAWTLDDLQDVLPFVEDRVDNNVATDDDVEDRFDKIGGIPRVIFATQQFFDFSVEQLDKSLKSLRKFDPAVLDSKSTHWHLVPNYVFTLLSKPPFDSKSTFAALTSQYVEEQLPKHLKAKQIEFLEQFAYASDGVNRRIWASAQGWTFEEVCKHHFTSGGKVRLRSLGSTPLPSEKQVIKMQFDDFSQKSPPPLNNQTIYWPKQKNFKAIDCFFIEQDVLVTVQATVSASRRVAKALPLMADCLKTILPLATNVKRVQLWYLVPSSLFEVFHVPIPRNSTGNQLPNAIPVAAASGGLNIESIPLECVIASWLDTETGGQSISNA